MVSKIKFLLPLFTLYLLQIQAQDFAYKKYTWEKNPVIHKLTDEEKENNYTYLKDKVIFEFAYEASGELVMYETRHIIIHFNNDKGIDEKNKIYIPYSTILEEMDLKARTITAEGKVIPLSKSSVKKVDDIENTGPYLIFAMEGVEKGGEIEYLYTNKKTPSIYRISNLQEDKLIKDVSVDIYSPANLIFEAKGYNGFPQFTEDTTIKDENHLYAKIDKIDALYDEKYSAYDANRMRYEFQLAYNTEKGNSRLYTWDHMGLDLYNVLFNFTKPETKAIEKLISKLQLEKLGSDELKIRALETYTKTNINNKERGESLTIDKMLELKYGDESTLQKFYIGAAKALNIPVEVVVTASRMKRKFDADFPSWNNLQDYLIYYPSIGKYLSSYNYSSRLGFPPPEIAGNKGLFIKETEIGELKTAVSKVKTVEATPVEKSYNNLNCSVTFDPKTFIPTINLKQTFMGYTAYYTQPSVPYLDDKQKQEFLDGMAKFIGKDVIVKSVSMTGGEQKDILVNPLVIDCVLEAPELVENANANYVFKVGELIGPQEEMYQEKKRQSDEEVHYMHSYTRLLNIKIPAGYKITNLTDINIDKKFISPDNKPLATFVSSYTIEGDVLKIKVFEEYRALHYSKEKFEEYRTVINASADFNKVALIFEKI